MLSGDGHIDGVAEEGRDGDGDVARKVGLYINGHMEKLNVIEAALVPSKCPPRHHRSQTG